jgi:hypothetical protein
MHAVGLARTEGAEGAALKTSLHGRDSARAISLRKHTIFIAIQGDSTRRVLALVAAKGTEPSWYCGCRLMPVDARCWFGSY